MINLAQIHVLIAGIPIVAVFGLVLLMLWGSFQRSKSIFGFIFYCLVVCLAVEIFLVWSGDEVVRLLDEFPGMNEAVIEAHQRWSLVFLAWTAFLSGLAAFFYYSKMTENRIRRLSSLFVVIIVLMGLVSFKMHYLALKVRHTEVRLDQKQNW